MQRTLCTVQCRLFNVDVCDVTLSSLQRLVDDGLVTRKQQQESESVIRLDVTRLGKAVYKGKCREILGPLWLLCGIS